MKTEIEMEIYTILLKVEKGSMSPEYALRKVEGLIKQETI